MTTKLEQAARQALDALELARGSHGVMLMSNPPHDAWQYRGCDSKLAEAITALREALDHSGESNEMVIGWDRVKPEAIASDPLYQQGFIDGVEEGRNQVIEQAEQEPDYFGLTHDHTWLSIEKKQYDKLKPEGRMACYAAPVRTKDLTPEDIKLPVDVAIGCGTIKAGCSLQTLLTRINVINETWIPKMQLALQHKRGCAYERIDQDPKECTCGVTEISAMLKTAAPVRTKDLTNDEIRKLWSDAELDITWFARAVIAADREKNK